MLKANSSIWIIFFLFIFAGKAISHVALDYPVGGETFQAGAVVTVQWHEVIAHGAGDYDLYFSPDNGTTWDPVSMNLPQSQLNYDWTVPNISTATAIIRIIQDNQTGIDYTDESGPFTITGTTGIGDFPNSPENFDLFPAFPNPFNSSTIISFYLPSASRVLLRIFNLLGEEVRVLANREFSAGSHALRWEAIDFPAGIYFYQISLPHTTKTGKLIFTK